MSDPARFGDFLAATAARLDAAVSGPRQRATADDIRATAQALLRLVTVMSRCIDATDPRAQELAWQHARQPTTWARTRAEARRALGKAASFLTAHAQPGPDADAAAGPAAPSTGPAARVATAAATLQVGHDLLQTHFGLGPDGCRINNSRWARAVGSDQATAAMLTELSGIAHRAAAQASGIALAPNQSATLASRRDLNSACQCLLIFISTIRAAQARAPVRTATRDLLRSIPVNTLRERHVPAGGETVAELCDGAIGSAERVRHAAARLTADATWSPAMSITSLVRASGAATVTSHNCEVLLTTLADGPATSHLRDQLLNGATAAARARRSWLTAARSLDDITTDTRGHLSPAAAEMNDLALWTGRLAFANPGWTPAAGPRHQHRTPADLASAPPDVQHVVAAVHYTCDTLATLARTSHEQLQAGARASRILVPTASLPEGTDVLYAFAPAPGTRLEPVLACYRSAEAASSQAEQDVGVVACALRARSRLLTVARDVGRSADELPASLPEPEPDRQPQRQDAEFAGPIQSTLHQLGITDLDMLKHAAALDRDGARLLIGAADGINTRAPSAATALSRSLDVAPVVNHAIVIAEPGSATSLHPQLPCADRQLEAT